MLGMGLNLTRWVNASRHLLLFSFIYKLTYSLLSEIGSPKIVLTLIEANAIKPLLFLLIGLKRFFKSVVGSWSG